MSPRQEVGAWAESLGIFPLVISCVSLSLSVSYMLWYEQLSLAICFCCHAHPNQSMGQSNHGLSLLESLVKAAFLAQVASVSVVVLVMQK